eukprot:GEZU01040231.1.p1 GENE.GEZU01040231.1~~GEZU01040231.1.p1  ORF type:complete len:206 (+),score=69.30 GEZU01040231.1:60-677(+)
MSRKKGLSYEEKRIRMQEIFFERKMPFTLKELEKIAPKEKGIIFQSVKDVLQSLVSDELVESDKIGTSQYYWSLPSQASFKRKRKIEALENQIEELKKERHQLEEDIAKESIGKEETAERLAKLEENRELKRARAELEVELQKYADFDPELLELMKEEIKIARDAANRWTDNIFTLRKYCREKFNLEEKDFNESMEIPEDLDNIY